MLLQVMITSAPRATRDVATSRSTSGRVSVRFLEVEEVVIQLPHEHRLIVKPTDVDVPVVMAYPDGHREAIESIMFDLAATEPTAPGLTEGDW